MKGISSSDRPSGTYSVGQNESKSSPHGSGGSCVRIALQGCWGLWLSAAVVHYRLLKLEEMNLGNFSGLFFLHLTDFFFAFLFYFLNFATRM